MKFIHTSDNRLINLANITDIAISANYIIATTSDGREERVMYGAEETLKSIFDSIIAFISEPTATILHI